MRPRIALSLNPERAIFLNSEVMYDKHIYEFTQPFLHIRIGDTKGIQIRFATRSATQS